MRLKLVLIASLLAGVVGAGASIAIILGVFASLKPLSSPGPLAISTFVLPVAAVSYASIFVYRHTARRRKLQAVLTAILALLLCLSAFIAASLIASRLPRGGSATGLCSTRRPLMGRARQTLNQFTPARLSSIQFPFVPDAVRRSQNVRGHPDQFPTPQLPDEYHRD